jgi:hypothetical protein
VIKLRKDSKYSHVVHTYVERTPQKLAGTLTKYTVSRVFFRAVKFLVLAWSPGPGWLMVHGMCV